MTGTSNRAALGLIALAGFALRVFPFFGPDGAWSYRVDYDEGVYFSGAAFLLDGVLPYRDFVFVHPPGILLFLAATSGWTHSLIGVAGAFALSRWVSALMGVVNIVLVAQLVPSGCQRWKWGPLFAAAVYATYPEIVQGERGPFLEPLLNLVSLSMVSTLELAAQRVNERTRWLVVSGGLAGLAMSIKVWAILWILGALWAVTSFATRRGFLLLLGGAAVVAGMLVAPFAWQAPQSFVTEVGLFHLWRPPDGLTERLPRIEQIFAARHLASPILALTMLGLLLARRVTWTGVTRVVGVAYALTVLAYFASAAWWSQYNAHLVATEAILAGSALSWMLARLKRGAQFSLLAVLAISLAVSVSHSIRRGLPSNAEHLTWAHSSLKHTNDCVFAFEPGWLLAAGRLPPRIQGVPLVIDTYAHQLLATLASGQRFSNTEEAFQTNTTPLPILDGCQFILWNERARKQMSPALMDRLSHTHTRIEINGQEVWRLEEPTQYKPSMP